MRVDLNANVGPMADTGATGTAGSRAVSSTRSTQVEADRAQFSTERVKLDTLGAAVLRLPEVRQWKVAALAEQMQNGSYQGTAGQTAEALLTALTMPRAG